MPLFKYKVADAAGRVQQTLVEGDSEAEATRQVRARGLVPLQFLGTAEGSAPAPGLARGGGVDVVDFTDRLAPLLEAQIPLERALAILEETSGNPAEQQLLMDFRRGLHEGRKFSQLVRDRGKLFPRMYAGIVEAGEESGALAGVLTQLREYLIMTRELRQYVISSSIYPVILLVFCLLVNGLLLGVVVPRFARVLLGMGRTPRLPTQILLVIADFVHNYWWALLAALAAAIAALLFLLRQPRTRDWLDEWLLRLPVLRRLVLLSELARLTRTMSILMRSGVPLLNTVSLSAQVLQNGVLRRSLANLGNELRKGERLSAALHRVPYMPPLVIRMLAVGEETGEAETMLGRLADRYDSELRHLIKRCLAWFEPLVILLLGGMVGSIVYVLFMAVLDVQASF